MSGADWFVVTLLAGAVIVDVAFDRLRQRIARRRREAYDADSHHRLMAELERQP